ncbi:hypothetical protein QTP86_017014 [Hemibagrus guttatus]|nr:hypothetical protein QTP86_017014 [Hemibagrus guttatus]
MFASAPLLLLALAPYVFCATELIQPDSLLIKPGETLTITCKVSGASITDSSSHYGTAWIRQPAGKTLEWINTIYYDGSINSCSQTLIQSDPVIIKPDQSHKLTCTASGLDFDSYYMAWIRQAPGKGLEWVSTITHTSSSKWYSSAVQGRFTISRDNNSCSQILIESDPVIIKPDQSHKLTCTASGFNFGGYWMAWIRQAPGKGLEWVAIISGDSSSIYYSSAVKGRFTISRDNNSYGQSLTSSASVVKKPGESVTLSCTVSGLSLSWLHWIRQKPGQGLEWIGRIDDGTGTVFAQSLQGQFSITKDTNKNMLYLEVKSLKAEDTAVYYCARQSH